MEKCDFVIGRAVKKTRFYEFGSAKFHEKVSVRTVCTVNPIRNSTRRNDGVQTPLGVSRQLLTGQKKQISDGVKY